VSHPVTIFNRDSASQGCYTSFLVPATAHEAMGYCYIGGKSWWLSDVTFVRMHNMANDVETVSKKLEHVHEVDSLEISHEILATRRPGILSNDSKLMVAKLFDDYLAEMGMHHAIHVKIIRSVHAIGFLTQEEKEIYKKEEEEMEKTSTWKEIICVDSTTNTDGGCPSSPSTFLSR